MRNMLAFVGAAIVAFLAVGWYLDWYKIQSKPAADGQRSFNVDLNTRKINEDVSKGEDRIKEVISGAEQEAEPVREDVVPLVPQTPPSTESYTPRKGVKSLPQHFPYPSKPDEK